jgi:arylsulfatase A-like enzyme
LTGLTLDAVEGSDQNTGVLDAARGGAAALAVYAAVETLFLDLLPWVAGRNDVPGDPWFAAALFAVSVLAGAAGAAVLTIAARTIGRRVPPRESGTLVLLLFCAGALIGSGGLRSMRAVMLALCLAAVLASLTSARARHLLSPLTSAWTVSLLLFAPWAVKDLPALSSRVQQAVAALLTAVLVIGVMALLIRRTSARVGRAATLLAVVLVSLGAMRPAPGPAEGRPLRRVPEPGPNILLVTLDTVRADRLSLYGQARDTTPFLRRFANSATVYRRAIAPSNMTLSTHASIFTGKFGVEHGAHYDKDLPGGRPLAKEWPTLAELYSRRGYDTSAVVANFGYLGAGFGLDRGFLHVDARTRRSSLSFEPLHSLRSLFRGPARLIAPDRWPRNDRSSRTADQITEAAIARIDAARAAHRPYFLFVNYFDAHDRIFIPSAYRARFGVADTDAAATRFEALTTGSLLRGSVPVGPDDEGRLLSAYDAAIAFVDSEVDRLLRHVSSAPSGDDTLIVITSDHGESFGDHGLMAHGTSLYDTQIRVPLAVRLPGQTAREEVDAPVSLVGLFDLLAGKTNRLPQSEDAISEAFPLTDHGVAGRRSGRSLSRGHYKLIRPLHGPLELYDVVADPAETRNLASNPLFRPLAAELSAALDAWVARHPSAERGAAALDPETAARLRALGYLR